MTLLDAPKFDEARYRRNRNLLISTTSTLFVLFVIWWLVAGHPIDWPWNWDNHIFGTATFNRFLSAVEKDDLPKAYGIWFHDPNWQQHPAQYNAYTFQRFQQDWAPASPNNEYGVIRSHQIVAERMNGNVLIVGAYINGQKTNALFLAYDPKSHQLSFSPVQLYLGP